MTKLVHGVSYDYGLYNRCVRIRRDHIQGGWPPYIPQPTAGMVNALSAGKNILHAALPQPQTLCEMQMHMQRVLQQDQSSHASIEHSEEACKDQGTKPLDLRHSCESVYVTC